MCCAHQGALLPCRSAQAIQKPRGRAGGQASPAAWRHNGLCLMQLGPSQQDPVSSSHSPQGAGQGVVHKRKSRRPAPGFPVTTGKSTLTALKPPAPPRLGPALPYSSPARLLLAPWGARASASGSQSPGHGWGERLLCPIRAGCGFKVKRLETTSPSFTFLSPRLREGLRPCHPRRRPGGSPHRQARAFP